MANAQSGASARHPQAQGSRVGIVSPHVGTAEPLVVELVDFFGAVSCCIESPCQFGLSVIHSDTVVKRSVAKVETPDKVAARLTAVSLDEHRIVEHWVLRAGQVRLRRRQ